MKAVQVSRTGGPEVLELVDLPTPTPAPGEILVRHTAIGLNFIDTYHRSGLYPLPLPFTPGQEGAGVVEAVGEGVAHLAKGDRVAYAWGPVGAYAEYRTIAADRVVKLPEGLDDRIAAASLLKACTVEYLVCRTYPVKAGETVLWHAAAGGVGLLAVQWLKSIGATVIGTAGSPEKAALARAHDCDHVILYREEDVATRVKELTGGRGVPVVFDSVGKDTFEASLNCLQPRGLMVSFGNASGPVTGVDLGILSTKGSLYVTRPTLIHYYATPEERERYCAQVFGKILNGELKVEIEQTFKLADIAEAHRALAARKTTGCTIIEP